MRKILLFSAFLFLLLFFFSSFSSRPTFAANSCPAGTCSSTCCNDSYSAPMCNGTTCQTQGYYCSAGKCVYGWAGGQPSSACNPACSGGTVPPPSGGSCSPIGAERCLNLSTPQTCFATGWTSGECPLGHYCTVVGTNSVSCIKGCSERGLTCTSDSICKGEGGKVWPTYYCSSGVCCQFSTGSTCTDGARRCLDGCTYQVCDKTGNWNPTTHGCPANSGCTPLSAFPYASCQTSAASQCSSSTITGCPVCTSPYYYDPYTGKCAFFRDSQDPPITYSTPTYQTCSAEQTCRAGCGCNCTLPKGFTSGSLPCGTEGIQCYTALGPIKLDPASLVKDFFGIVLSISGGIAVLLIILSGYRLIASQGNPEKINEAKEHLTAAIIGLLFVIFSFSILRFIGVDILGIFP